MRASTIGERTLTGALDLGVEHVSAYALTVEPGTPLGRHVAAGSSPAPDDDDQAEKYVLADTVLGAAGFEWYEISNWARAGHACRHNECYWAQGEYLAIGCAAHGHTDGRRWWNVRTPERYIDRIARGESPEADFEVLDAPTRRDEAFALALRTRGGAVAPPGTEAEVAALVEGGLLDRDGDACPARRAPGGSSPTTSPRGCSQRRCRWLALDSIDCQLEFGGTLQGRSSMSARYGKEAHSRDEDARAAKDAPDAVEANLDDRKAAVLRAIIEQYVASAQPVGSATVTRSADLGVSAATVRNEMSMLEREGYITQPHTSAGRVPTDRGYRYYVDHLAGVTTLAPTGAAADRRVLHVGHDGDGRPVAPDEPAADARHRARRRRGRAAGGSGRDPRCPPRAAATAGRARRRHPVERRGREAGGVPRRGRLGRRRRDRERPARANCSTVTASATSRRGPTTPLPDDAIAERLARAACDALGSHLGMHHAEPLYVGGASRLAAEPDAFTGTTVARLIELLEHHVVLASLMREMLGPGLTVRIGSENANADLQEVSRRARAVSGRRRAGGYRRRPRPDPHGLPQGAGRGGNRLPTSRPATLPVTSRNLNPHG